MRNEKMKLVCAIFADRGMQASVKRDFRVRVLSAALSISLLTGCEVLHQKKNPHNDVLVFGTGTKFGLDVSAPVQSGGIPEFTIGYKRLEAVWMPLKVNGSPGGEVDEEYVTKVVDNITKCVNEPGFAKMDEDKRNMLCLNAVLPADKYVAISSGIDNQKGGTQYEWDTYSVFASLGGKGALSFNSASGSMAQFFATGIAAQRLGANASVASILNANAPKAEADKAKAEAEKAKAEVEQTKEIKALLDSGATKEQAAAIVEGNVAAIREINDEVAKANECIQGWQGSVPAGLDGALTNDMLKPSNAERLGAEIAADSTLRKRIIENCSNGGA